MTHHQSPNGNISIKKVCDCNNKFRCLITFYNPLVYTVSSKCSPSIHTILCCNSVSRTARFCSMFSSYFTWSLHNINFSVSVFLLIHAILCLGLNPEAVIDKTCHGSGQGLPHLIDHQPDESSSFKIERDFTDERIMFHWVS